MNRDIVDDITGFNELRKTFRTVKDVEAILQSMLTSVANVASHLDARFTDAVNKTKFSALPDDILANIFELSAQEIAESDVTMGTRLLMVSRRFNRIATNLPFLWSTISYPHRSVEQVKRFSSLATAPSISLSIAGNRAENRIVDVCQIMTSISSRIWELSLTLGDCDLRYLAKVLDSCSSCSFPSLVRLELECDKRVRRRCVPLCRDWDMPSLRDLELNNIIPEFRADVLKQIDDCFIGLNEPEDDFADYWRHSEIATFLSSLTSVTCLRASVQNPRDDPPDHVGTLSMPSVKKLVVTLQSFDAVMLMNILDYVVFPEIDSFELQLVLPDLKQLGVALDTVQTSLRRGTREGGALVKQLVLGVEQITEQDAPFGEIARWAGEFQNLERIILECQQHCGRGLFSLTDAYDTFELRRREEPLSETMSAMLDEGSLS